MEVITMKGAETAGAISKAVTDYTDSLKAKMEQGGKLRLPKLVIVRVGERPDDLSYERGAVKRMEKVGIECSVCAFPADISHEDFEREFLKINQDNDVDGILMLRPLPKTINEKRITELMDPSKDVDCITPVNLGKIFLGEKDGFAPCTAQAVMEMIDTAGIDLTGKNVTVIGRSLVVGKPLAQMLMAKNATVTQCHTKTVNTPRIASEADVIVACAGVRKMVDSTFLSEKTMAIFDVGINVDEDGKLCGDVDFDQIVSERAESDDPALIMTPVPGGVGAVTNSVLAAHVLESYKRKFE